MRRQGDRLPVEHAVDRSGHALPADRHGSIHPDYNDFGASESTIWWVASALGFRAPRGAPTRTVCAVTAPLIPPGQGRCRSPLSPANGISTLPSACPLTSPIPHGAAETADPFGAGIVPHGYCSFPYSKNGKRTGTLAYGAVFGMSYGIAGDWRDTRYTDANWSAGRGCPTRPRNDERTPAGDRLEAHGQLPLQPHSDLVRERPGRPSGSKNGGSKNQAGNLTYRSIESGFFIAVASCNSPSSAAIFSGRPPRRR